MYIETFFDIFLLLSLSVAGVVELPNRMKNKYKFEKPDELQEFENNADAPLWDYEYIRNKYWKQLPLKPEKEEFKGIERIQLGKLHRITYKNCFEKQQKTYLELKKEREQKKAIEKGNAKKD
jgi:hypothetical protein